MAQPLQAELPLRERTIARALAALAGQHLKADGPEGCGRWGGTLEGDWDSAIHSLIELVVQGTPLPQDVESPTGLEALLRHVVEIVRRPGGIPDDTRRINSLVLISLVRLSRMRRAPNAACKLAARYGSQLFEGDDARTCESLLEGGLRNPELTRFLEACVSEVRTRRAPRLGAELRAYLVLAAFPRGARADLSRAAVELLEALYAHASGSELTEGEAGDWPPLVSFANGALVGTALYVVASRALAAGLFDGAPSTFGEFAFDFLLPAPDEVRGLVTSLGGVAQAKDLSAALGLLLAPSSRLADERTEAWKDYVLDTRGPLGLHCYLPLTTGLAVAALERYADGRRVGGDAPLRRKIEQSLVALRRDRVEAPGHAAHGLPFAQYAVYNEIVLRTLMLVWGSEELRARYPRWGDVVPAVRYILASQATNGLFHERYGANEPEEGEAAGSTLRTLANFSRLLDDACFASTVGLPDDEARRSLQRELAWALELGVSGFLELQNESGGFATFARTDREKRGALGVFEGPGAQEFTFFDTPAADSTSWCIDGLSTLGSRAALRRPVPLLALRPSVLKDIDAAIERGLGWLRRDFHHAAGWWSRYGGGYVSGTAFALRALRAAGVPPSDPQIARAAALFKERQHEAGGWGQTTEAEDPKHNREPGSVAMRGEVDPELTGLALLGLLDAGVSSTDPAVHKGVAYLVHSAQNGEGGFVARASAHTFMRRWNYVDQLHVDLRPTEALLRVWLQQPDDAL